LCLEIDMNAATALALTETPDEEIDGVVEHSILRFLNGESDGRDLFQALYGETIDEPVPAEMLALVRRACSE
jgi:hypothetical protein